MSTFSLLGDLDIELSATQEGEIKVDVAGIDVCSKPGDTFAARVWGFFTPAEARAFAQRLTELADEAEGKGAAPAAPAPKLLLGDILAAISSAKADGLDVEAMLNTAVQHGRSEYSPYFTYASEAQKLTEAAQRHGLRAWRGEDYEDDEGGDTLWAQVGLYWGEKA